MLTWQDKPKKLNNFGKQSTIHSYLLVFISSSQGHLFPIVPAIRTVNGCATFENLYLPACSRSYSQATIEDKEILEGRGSQGQKYVLFYIQTLCYLRYVKGLPGHKDVCDFFKGKTGQQKRQCPAQCNRCGGIKRWKTEEGQER